MAQFRSGTMERCCDDWVAQVKEAGHSQRRYVDFYGRSIPEGQSAVFYEGTRLYSHGHHYLLAELVYVGGKTVGVVNHEPYAGGYNARREIKDTPSTQNHRGIAEGALRRADMPVIQALGMPFCAAADIQAHRKRAIESLTAATRRRKYPEHCVHGAARSLERAREIARVFGGAVEPLGITPAVHGVLATLRGHAVRQMIRHGETGLRDALEALAA